VRPRSANEWRDFWRDGGERELHALLEKVAGTGSRRLPNAAVREESGTCPRGDISFAPYSVRIATLLGSNAPLRALVSELGRIREHELGAPPDPGADAELAGRIYAWFEAASLTR
jgi:hypothetical protein